jgi:hypothetical protein
MLLKSFIYKTLFLSLITSALCIIVFLIFVPDRFNLIYPVLPFIFGIINVFIFYTLFTVKDSSLLKFSNRYLLCTTVKLLGSLIFIVIYLLLNRETVVTFLSTFLSVYFIFLFQEIIGILKFFKKNEKSESTHAKT